MNKILKNLIVIIIFASLIVMFSPTIYSNASVSGKVGTMNVSTVEANSNIEGINNLISVILGFLQVTSGLIAVVVIAFTGFSYITAETVDLKKELKGRMLPIVIGLVLIFGAVSITNFILGVTS